MAWYKSEVTANDSADAFAKVHTFITGTLGWTLHDDQSAAATPYYVYYTDGSDGRRRYYQLVSGPTIVLRMWRFWDSITQTGYNQTGPASWGIYTHTSAFNLFMYGDPDALIVVSKIGSNCYLAYTAKIDPLCGGDFTSTTALAEAGSSVNIEVTDDTLFEVGQKYTILNTNSADGVHEIVEVTAVGTGQITVATLANDHPAGAYIGRDALPVMLHASTSNAAGAYYSAIGAGATSSAGHPCCAMYFVPNTSPLTLDDVTGQQPLIPISLATKDPQRLHGTFPHVFSLQREDLVNEDIFTVNGTTYKVFELAYFAATTAPAGHLSSRWVVVKTDE